MNKFKKVKILAIVISLVILFYGQNRLLAADETLPWSSQFYSYRFHLYYDNGQLFANRDFNFKYDIISDDFTQEVVSTTHPFRGEIVSGKEEVLSSFKFDPQKGNPVFKKGSIAVDGPYFTNAAKVNFYNNKNQLLLTLDVSGSSFCNDDGTCNSDVGENYQNCPNDCRPPVTPTPVLTTIPGGGLFSQPLVLIILLVVIVVIVVLAVWFIIKKKRKIAESKEIPPSVPPLTQ